ncbi:MAG: hypothetical protein HRU07_01935 [Nitrosopumilus sp.]|nr:hypothetical protein [Nitrosopumilus sp.]NRA04934.1 hypothetical protein [Nitrosopumilus sp.]
MSTNNSISVCDIFKDNTSKVIKKLEMQIPSHFQIYSDMYKEYLHVIDDIFGTCILSEKEFFDKMKIDKNLMKNIETFTNYFTGIGINQIENYDNYLKWYAQMRISGMKSYDQFVHTMMNSYSKTLANFMIDFEK